MRHYGKLALILCALGFSTQTRAIAPFKLMAFQATGILVQTNVNEFSGHLAWIPSVNVGPIGVRLEVGLTNLTNTGVRFWAVNTEGYISFSMIPTIAVELGGGIANWMGNGGANPIFGGNLVVSVPLLMDRIYAGYSRYLHPTVPANIIKLGIGFNL